MSKMHYFGNKFSMLRSQRP